MIRFLIELFVRRTLFGQFGELYFVLNWLIMRCKLLPELATEAQQTAWSKMYAKVKSVQHTLIIPHRVIELTTISSWVKETRLRLPQVTKSKTNPSETSEVPSDTVVHLHFYFFLIHTRALCYPPVRDKVCQSGRIFPEHAEQSFLDPAGI